MTHLIHGFSASLLEWFSCAHRPLPWRRLYPQQQDPYKVWISEIMLQQTTVTTVIPFFEAFVKRWPTVHDLASSSIDDVLHAWQGLGYYSRARNLHKCAKILSEKGFPFTYKELLSLPGIGPYTAGAIASIAFGAKVPAIDGNVTRVMSRMGCLNSPQEISKLAQDLLPDEKNGDYTQALMDLGATICTPKSPSCDACPVKQFCKSFKEGSVHLYPLKKDKKSLPTRYGYAFWYQNEEGEIFLEKRPTKGLLGGMMGLPTTEWTSHREPPKDFLRHITHTFTHFHLELWVVHAAENPGEGLWVSPSELKNIALPTLMKKAIYSVLD